MKTFHATSKSNPSLRILLFLCGNSYLVRLYSCTAVLGSRHHLLATVRLVCNYYEYGCTTAVRRSILLCRNWVTEASL
jgi:hypothetical protein